MASSPATRLERSSPASTASFDPAQVAAGLFRVRQSFAARQVAQGKLTRDQAEARLRPWLAVASAAGADLPEMERHGNEIWPDAGKPVTFRLYPSEICADHEWRGELARARDAALAALNPDPAPAKLAQARDLVALANHLGTRNWMP